MRVLELYDGEYLSYFVSDTGYTYQDTRQLLNDLRQPHSECYELHSFNFEYDINELTDIQKDEYFWGLINGNLLKDKQQEIFELFWRNSDEFWC